MGNSPAVQGQDSGFTAKVLDWIPGHGTEMPEPAGHSQKNIYIKENKFMITKWRDGREG